MEAVVRGWSKDHGENEVTKRDLLTASKGRFDSYARGKTYVTLQAPIASTRGSLFRRKDADVPAGVDIRVDAKIVLNGDYLFRISFDRFEIADLFFSVYGGLPLEDLVDLFSLIKLREGLRPLPFSPIMLKHVDKALELAVRSSNCLRNEGIVYVGDLVQMSEAQLLRIPNMGRHNLTDLKEALAVYNLKLGMNVPGWRPEDIETLARLVQDVPL